MLAFPTSIRIFLAIDPCDMRKSFNGLYAVASEQIGEDPRNGAVFLFSNRQHSRLKMLYWDGTGLWVMSKRLEKGTFSWPRSSEIGTKKISLAPEALSLLINGIDLKGVKMRPWYERDSNA